MPNRLVLHTDSAWISPYVFSCFVALHEKELPFETSSVSLETGEQNLPGFRDRALTGRVPALQHGSFWLAESSAIVEYLDEAFPDRPRMLPEDVRERARARQIMAWLRSDLLALREERPTTTMFYKRATEPLTTAGQEAARKLAHVADLLIDEGKESLFSAFSVADADLAFMLHRLILNGHDLSPKARAFAETQWHRPSVQAFVVRERTPAA
jgi:glutathione S-transferase